MAEARDVFSFDWKTSLRGAKRRSNPVFLCGFWIASRSLSSGRPSAGPVGSQWRRVRFNQISSRF